MEPVPITRRRCFLLVMLVISGPVLGVDSSARAAPRPGIRIPGWKSSNSGPEVNRRVGSPGHGVECRGGAFLSFYSRKGQPLLEVQESAMKHLRPKSKKKPLPLEGLSEIKGTDHCMGRMGIDLIKCTKQWTKAV